ncbi:MAG: ribosome-binding factor A [Polyangiaceae bacterium]
MGQKKGRWPRGDARAAELRGQRRGADGNKDDGGRREQQLCREAFEAIGFALASLDDATWLDVTVVSVEPAPDASRLAVRVRVGESLDTEAVLEKLERIGGYLRAELALAIQRKRVPALTFRAAEPEESGL